MNKIVLLSFILIQAQIVAQVTVSGKIIDEESNLPMIGTQIILDTGGGTVTDKNGDFSLNINKGSYSGVVTYLGYEQKKITINTQHPDLGTILLHP